MSNYQIPNRQGPHPGIGGVSGPCCLIQDRKTVKFPSILALWLAALKLYSDVDQSDYKIQPLAHSYVFKQTAVEKMFVSDLQTLNVSFWWTLPDQVVCHSELIWADDSLGDHLDAIFCYWSSLCVDGWHLSARPPLSLCCQCNAMLAVAKLILSDPRRHLPPTDLPLTTI